MTTGFAVFSDDPQLVRGACGRAVLLADFAPLFDELARAEGETLGVDMRDAWLDALRALVCRPSRDRLRDHPFDLHCAGVFVNCAEVQLRVARVAAALGEPCPC
jgi:hypothetical protein